MKFGGFLRMAGAVDHIRAGKLGEVKLVKCLAYKRRKSIGTTQPEPVPPGIDWDLFLGPAPKRPYVARYPQGHMVYGPEKKKQSE